MHLEAKDPEELGYRHPLGEADGARGSSIQLPESTEVTV